MNTVGQWWGRGWGLGPGCGEGGGGRACLSGLETARCGGTPTPLVFLGDPGKPPCRAVHGGDDAGSSSRKGSEFLLEDGGGDGWQGTGGPAGVVDHSSWPRGSRLVLESWRLGSAFHRCVFIM